MAVQRALSTPKPSLVNVSFTVYTFEVQYSVPSNASTKSLAPSARAWDCQLLL